MAEWLSELGLQPYTHASLHQGFDDPLLISQLQPGEVDSWARSVQMSEGDTEMLKEGWAAEVESAAALEACLRAAGLGGSAYALLQTRPWSVRVPTDIGKQTSEEVTAWASAAGLSHGQTSRLLREWRSQQQQLKLSSTPSVLQSWLQQRHLSAYVRPSLEAGFGGIGAEELGELPKEQVLAWAEEVSHGSASTSIRIHTYGWHYPLYYAHM